MSDNSAIEPVCACDDRFPDTESIETICDLLNDIDMFKAALADVNRQLSAAKAELAEVRR